MIYLREELELFEKMKRQFGDQYMAAMKEAGEVANARGERLDTGTPIHHRTSPEGLVYEVAKKARRVQGMLETDMPPMSKIREECIDIVNYALFLAAICSMVMEDQDEASDDRSAPMGHEVSEG